MTWSLFSILAIFSVFPALLTGIVTLSNKKAAAVYAATLALSCAYFTVYPPPEPVDRVKQFREAGCTNTGYHERYDSRLWSCPDGLIYRE